VEPKLKFRALAPAPKFLAPAPEQFGALKTKNHCIICTVGLLYKIRLLNGNSKILGSGSIIQNILAPAPQPWLERTVLENK